MLAISLALIATAGLVLAILAGIPEVGNDRGDPRRAGPLGGIHEQQQLEDVFRRRIGRLDDEDIAAADVLVDLDEDLAVGKPLERHLAQLGIQVLRHFLGERAVG